MAATLVLDTVSRATILETPTFGRIVRTGFVKGLKTLGLPSNRIAANVTNAVGMPPFHDPYPDPRYSNLYLVQRIVEGIDGNSDKVNVTLVYESNNGYFAPVTFVLSRRTTMVEDTTEIHPGTGRPMTVKWKNPANAADFVERTARFRYRRAHQVIVAEGYYTVTPPTAMIDALGTVNDGIWRNKPKGYWYYSGQSDVTRDFGNTYNITLEVESKLTQDWSQYQVIEGEHGRYLPVSDVSVNLLQSQPYNFGVLTHNGITKVGLYPTANFASLFGFGGIGL